MDQNKEKSVDEMLDNTKEVVKEADDVDFAEKIETARKTFREQYRKSKVRSNITTFLAVGVVAAAFILILQKSLPMQIVGYSLGGVAIVGMLVYFLVTRKTFPNQTEEYVHKIIIPSYNAHTFKDSNYTELTSDRHDTFESSEFLIEGVYADISRLSSRNIVNGKFMGHSFRVGDLAMVKAEGKGVANLFVGKYVSYPNNLHFENRYVIVIKNKDNEKQVDLPNGIDDLVALEEEEGFAIYGKEGANYKKDIGSKFISQIKEIKIERDLLNLSIVLWAGHSAAYLSYTDSIIAIPFENEFDGKAFDDYAKTLLHVLTAFNELVK